MKPITAGLIGYAIGAANNNPLPKETYSAPISDEQWNARTASNERMDKAAGKITLWVIGLYIVGLTIFGLICGDWSTY